MWHSSYACTDPGLDRDAARRVWREVKGGPSADAAVEQARLGAHRCFTDVALRPRARLYDAHAIEDSPQGLRLTPTLEDPRARRAARA